MKSKKLLVVLFGMMLVFGMVAIGCDNNSEPTYCIETTWISEADILTFLRSVDPKYLDPNYVQTFQETLKVREDLMKFSVEDSERYTGVTEAKLIEILDLPPSKYALGKKELDQTGNLLVIYSDAWFYIEEE
ncbi:hypothetical protein AGMMS49942_02080 [Spirochaetia bacterium]|nr:hypothetical protein AGMMS49942_02080 [Spirochaetia bacterium]